jgi:hypothetical protein
MSITDSEELAKAKKDVEASVAAYIAIREKEDNDVDNIYVVAWAVHAEYLKADDINDGKTTSVSIVKEDQMASATMGLFEFGKQDFSQWKR